MDSMCKHELIDAE